MKSVENNGTKDIHSVEYRYNAENNLETLIETINGTVRTTAYTYDSENRVTSVTADGVTVTYTYDDFGRVTEQVTSNGVDEEGNPNIILTEEFGYTTRTVTDENGTDVTLASGQVATYTTTAGSNTLTYSYEYDDNGNITSVVSTSSNSDGTNSTRSTVTYEYDSANQLIRENNQDKGYTHTWTYDNAGNILERREYAYTTGELSTATRTVNYGYPVVTDPENNTVWGDLLTSFDGKAIEYDAIGNPTRFGVTENGSDRTYTWEHGRQLKSLTEGSTTWNYTYDAGGMRTGRTNGTSANTYTYIYTGSQLTQMKKGNETLTFTYDASGIPLTVTHGSTKYYYATNLQGDVVAILNSNGSEVGTYTYDAWGNCTATGTAAITELNPLRYRGYVYDQETGLYYLQSRYYDPEVGRFINADTLISTGHGILGNNMFAYCQNSPIIFSDANGHRMVCRPAIMMGGIPYITDQDDENIGNKSIGSSTVEHGGCGAVAIYNAQLDLGSPQSFDEILAYFNKNRNSELTLDGWAGISPFSVKEYFTNQGYRVIMTDDRDGIDIYSKTADACILYYVYENDPSVSNIPYGAHFISYRKYGDGYVGMNTSGSSGIQFFDTPSSYGYLGQRIYAVGIFIYK